MPSGAVPGSLYCSPGANGTTYVAVPGGWSAADSAVREAVRQRPASVDVVVVVVSLPDVVVVVWVVAVPAGTASKIKTQVARPDPLVAPFAKGQPVGTLKVSLGEQPLVDVPLVALDAVPQAGVFGRAWDALRLWIK